MPRKKSEEPAITVEEEISQESIPQQSDEPLPVTEKDEYYRLCQLVNSISKPLANRKLAKKVYKLVKKSAKEKGFLKQGLADVMKALRRDEKGIVLLAGLYCAFC